MGARWLCPDGGRTAGQVIEELAARSPTQQPANLAAAPWLCARRVGEGEEFGGWDELPPCFSTLVNLQQLTLGTFTHFLMHPGKTLTGLLPMRIAPTERTAASPEHIPRLHPCATDDHAALAPLLAAQGLRELCLPKSLIGALPDVVTSLTALTLLGVAGEPWHCRGCVGAPGQRQHGCALMRPEA